MRVKFWGVRGSVPAPLTGLEVEKKMALLFEEFVKSGRSDWQAFLAEQPFWKRATYGGNTSCVEVVASGKRIVCDLGTGARPLGVSLMKEMFEKNGLELDILLSHVHWDHIQGFPFFSPAYVNWHTTGINNQLRIRGGTNWQKTAGECLEVQMSSPSFPVTLQYIKQILGKFETEDVFDGKRFSIGDVQVTARQLDHPQETYGYRLFDKKENKTAVYATDNEPRDPLHPHPNLLALAKNADLIIVDCQYTKDTYEGKVGGIHRHGWGHSDPGAVAQVAVQAGVKQMALFHHDPASSDEQIEQMAEYAQNLVYSLGGKTEVVAAYEGLELEIGKKPTLVHPHT